MSFKVINELPQHTNLDSIKRSLLWCETGFRGRVDTIIENCRFFDCLTKDVYDILKMDNIDDFFCLVEKSRAIRYLSLAYKYMSKEDCAKALRNVWERVDNVNSHHVLSKGQFVKMFKLCDHEDLMEEDELEYFKRLPEEITVYRGLEPVSNNVKALSWTLSYKTADWFANRFTKAGVYKTPGSVYQATIRKEHVFAYINGRNENEIVLDYNYLTDIHEVG